MVIIFYKYLGEVLLDICSRGHPGKNLDISVPFCGGKRLDGRTKIVPNRLHIHLML